MPARVPTSPPFTTEKPETLRQSNVDPARSIVVLHVPHLAGTHGADAAFPMPPLLDWTRPDTCPGRRCAKLKEGQARCASSAVFSPVLMQHLVSKNDTGASRKSNCAYNGSRTYSVTADFACMSLPFDKRESVLHAHSYMPVPSIKLDLWPKFKDAGEPLFDGQ